MPTVNGTNSHFLKSGSTINETTIAKLQQRKRIVHVPQVAENLSGNNLISVPL